MSLVQPQATSAPVVYIMSRFPLLTETFILREMLELERQGVELRIFPLLRVQAPVRHAETEQLMPRVHFTPFLSRAILAANLHFLRRAPRRYLRTLWAALAGTCGSRNLFVGALGILPKSVYFARLIEREGVRHVHAHYATHPALAALVISELTGATYSFTAHAHDIFVHQQMLRQKIEKAHFIVAISEFNKQYLLRLAPRAAPDKIRVVRCGIEPEKYRVAADSPAAPIAGAQSVRDKLLTILSVASLQPYKGIRYLIESCRLLDSHLSSNFRCLIVGEGADRTALEKLIEESGLQGKVQLLGARPQHEVAALLGEADLFVLPSVVAPDGQMEGIPVALMEAMASCVPVVATRISGIPELVEEGVTGRLVPPADAHALARAILSLSEDESLRRRMGEEGRKRVSAEFGLRENVARLRALFQSATERGDEERGEQGNSANETHDRLSPELKRLVAERSSQFFFEGATNNGHAPISFTRRSGGHDSEVYELALAGEQAQESRAILKLHRPGRSAPLRAVEDGRRFARNEYEALALLWNEFSRRSARLSVPKPLAHLPEQAALIMEKCAGERLDDLLRWARLRGSRSEREQLLRQVEACGEWLALFHEVTGSEGDLAEVYARIESDFHVDLATCRGRGLASGISARLARKFEEGKAVAFDGEHRLVSRHCDFAPYNVILSDERLAVIDFEGMQRGIIYDDLCYFLGMVEVMPFYHLGGALSQRVRDSFMEGYARRGSIRAEHLKFFMLTTMVKLMAHSPLLGADGQGWRDRLKRRQRLKFFTNWFGKRVA